MKKNKKNWKFYAKFKLKIEIFESALKSSN
jgi:hypothetical protein